MSTLRLARTKHWTGPLADQLPCLTSHIIGCLQPDIPYPRHAVCGESGSRDVLPKKARSLVTGAVRIRVRDANCKKEEALVSLWGLVYMRFGPEKRVDSGADFAPCLPQQPCS
ncbi:hypothetical protein PTRG_02657 [Pyrenophora tritici-repentis Pt-1C-BFP]|uniref:Uncharacterized protein n=1 Tax=Pyrenophora tritici-repentis (strain Pt-1C-BFP) TaxID=426418 RepID=B2VZ17_PYRTR|nr:uncharacterized protein PTRG_02657 [Pyrenophora tritici-repentis Pt-1C-BFP]EDU45180.1 hypothetical protein PTRG_02657 [Pyrenophora tritici-repentis Pt-1C-BFP]